VAEEGGGGGVDIGQREEGVAASMPAGDCVDSVQARAQSLTASYRSVLTWYTTGCLVSQIPFHAAVLKLKGSSTERHWREGSVRARLSLHMAGD